MHLAPNGLIDKTANLQITVQVTAYHVIGENGQTGTLPTGVNFQMGSSSYGTTTDGKSAYMGASSQALFSAHQHYLWLLGACLRLLILSLAILHCTTATRNGHVAGQISVSDMKLVLRRRSLM